MIKLKDKAWQERLSRLDFAYQPVVKFRHVEPTDKKEYDNTLTGFN